MHQLRFAAIASAALVLLAAVPAAEGQVFVLDNRAAALRGADRLLAVQNPDGSFPWQVGNPAAFQNVQGITAIGLLEAYKLSLDARYLEGAKANRDWLEAYRNGAAPPRLLSAPNVYFLAEYALLSLTLYDYALARDVLQDRLDQFGGPEAVVTTIITARVNQGHTNLGLWDASLYIRAAQDVGWADLADRMAGTLATQTIVDPFAAGNNWYELGLTGVLLGLSEADFLDHRTTLAQASEALLAAQAADGSWPATFGGVAYPGDTQTTAYAVQALAAVAQLAAAEAGAGFLVGTQRADGGWASSPDDPTEYGETDAEAVMALVHAAVPVPNGVLAYADACSPSRTAETTVGVECRFN